MMTPAYRKSYLIAVTMVIAAFFSIVLTPKADEGAEVPDFEAMIPKVFGEWKMLDTPIIQANLVPQGGEDERFPYDAVLTRAYRDGGGNVMLLAIAYTKNQKQERKIHRPELCYYGQGYSVKRIASKRHDIAGQSVYVQQLLARQRSRMEPVTYWIRLGDRTVDGPWNMRTQILWKGLKGESLDGTLVRVSSISSGRRDINDAFEAQERFIDELIQQVPSSMRYALLGNV